MKNQSSKPIGHVGLPALLCAFAGTLLSVGLDVMGFYEAPATALTEYWAAEPFYLSEAIAVKPVANYAIAFSASWLVALLTLGSAFKWRKLLVCTMFLSLLLGFAPVLVLWGVLWIPFVAGVALFWTWICAFLYGIQHQMPCEAVYPTKAEAAPDVEPDVKSDSVSEEIAMSVETITLPIKKKS